VRWVAAIALAALLASCTTSPDGEADRARVAPANGRDASPTASPSPPASPSPSPEASPSPAPEPAAPSRSRFAGRIATIPPALEREMTGTTWHEGCPVPLEDLRLLRFNYWGFDGAIDRGPLIVNAAVADDVLWVFRQLFDAGFPMKRVGLARAFHERRWEEQPDSRRSVTASFNCRVVITPAGPGSTYSQHSYGLAIDVNPLQNPFVRSDGWVRNRFAEPYVDRSADLPGMIREGDVVVRSFAAIGWTWGGRWSGDRDYMHFSPSGT
jgi:hypothetical protein